MRRRSASAAISLSRVARRESTSPLAASTKPVMNATSASARASVRVSQGTRKAGLCLRQLDIEESHALEQGVGRRAIAMGSHEGARGQTQGVEIDVAALPVCHGALHGGQTLEDRVEARHRGRIARMVAALDERSGRVVVIDVGHLERESRLPVSPRYGERAFEFGEIRAGVDRRRAVQ
jgi:hypothetical protein